MKFKRTLSGDYVATILNKKLLSNSEVAKEIILSVGKHEGSSKWFATVDYIVDMGKYGESHRNLSDECGFGEIATKKLAICYIEQLLAENFTL